MLYRQSTGLWHSRDVDFRRVAMFLYTIGDLIAFILSIVFVIILFLVLFQLRAYFAERLISAETLRRNCVMQKRHGHEVPNYLES